MAFGEGLRVKITRVQSWALMLASTLLLAGSDAVASPMLRTSVGATSLEENDVEVSGGQTTAQATEQINEQAAGQATGQATEQAAERTSSDLNVAQRRSAGTASDTTSQFILNDSQVLSAETPLLDAASDGLIAQSDLTQTPILREGISSSPSNIETQIDNLSLQILLKQVELERYSIHYNQEAVKQGRWKGWRYGFWNEVNSGLGLAGGITSTVNRGKYLERPAGVRRRTQEGANIVPMIGTIIGAGAAGGEFGINLMHEFQAHQKGYGSTQAKHKVLALKTEINDMLDKRESLVRVEGSDPNLAGRFELDQVEGRVLRAMRDQKLQQFERFHLAKRRLYWFQQMQYLFDIAKNVTNASGYQQAYLSLRKRHRIYNGSAGVCFVVSGGLTMVGPVASRLFGKMMAEQQRRSLRGVTHTTEDATLAQLKNDHAMLDRLTKSGKMAPEKADVVLHRSAVYANGERQFEDEINKNEAANARAKLVATQNIGAAQFVGGSKIASGILFIIPGYNHRYNGKGFRADRGTNNSLFAAAVVSLPASTFSIIDTLRINIQGEMTRQKQLKAGTHPSQLAKKRLKELDDLEASIKADIR